MEEMIIDLLGEKFALDKLQTARFLRYLELLKEWNNKINLTALLDDQEIIIKHFYDSLLVSLAWPDLDYKRIIDFGTGAGFPGLPLKIAKPMLNVSLCDSLLKRIHFLNAVIDDLSLEKVTTIHSRVEDLGRDKEHRGQYDLVTARAVARLPILLELSIPLLKTGGVFLALKGPDAINELEESSFALRTLGAEHLQTYNYELPINNGQRIILAFQKTVATPPKYPRRPGIPQKRMLQKNL